jgi:hypothetical protein
MCRGQTGRQVRLERAKPWEVSILKTPKTIGLLAVPVVLAAAIVSATGAFAKAPAHQSAAANLATVKFSSAGSADAVKPAVAAAPAGMPAAPSQATTEPTESATEPATTETTDAAGGHADNPNDPNADHQFNGEE